MEEGQAGASGGAGDHQPLGLKPNTSLVGESYNRKILRMWGDGQILSRHSFPTTEASASPEPSDLGPLLDILSRGWAESLH